MDKLSMYKAGMFKFPVPPVTTAAWRAADWISYINLCGQWLPGQAVVDVELKTHTDRIKPNGCTANTATIRTAAPYHAAYGYDAGPAAWCALHYLCRLGGWEIW